MTLELERYYENRLAMFASQGWKDLIEDIAEMQKATNTLAGVTAETLHFKQGELSMMNWLVQLEKTSREAYADLSVQMPARSSDAAGDDLGEQDDRN